MKRNEPQAPAARENTNIISTSDVFATLESLGSGTVGQIAERLDHCDKAQIELALTDLCNIGIVRVSPFDPNMYIPTASPSAFALIVESFLRDFTKRLRLLETVYRLMPTATNGKSISENEVTEQFFEKVRGAEASTKKLHELTAMAEKTVDTYLPYIPTRSQLNDALPADTNLIKRGLSSRIIYSPIAEEDAGVIDYISHFPPESNSVHLSMNLMPPIRFSIIDNRIAYIRIVGETAEGSSFITNSAEVVALARVLFDHIWCNSTPFTAEKSVSVIPSAKEIALLRMLADGKTYTTIAKELKVATRTIDRMLESLELKLGVKSRFALALTVQRLGWLDGD